MKSPRLLMIMFVLLIATFLVAACGNAPPASAQGWTNLRDLKYKGQVSLAGDPPASIQAAQSVYAAALAKCETPSPSHGITSRWHIKR